MTSNAKTQMTLYNYFTKDKSIANIKQCLSCNKSLTAKQYDWHRDYDCINSKYQKLKKEDRNYLLNNSKKKKAGKFNKKIQKKSILSDDEDEVVILENLCDKKNISKCFNERCISPSLFSGDDKICVSSLPRKKVASTIGEKKYLQQLKEDWSSPENSPFKDDSNALSNLGKDIDKQVSNLLMENFPQLINEKHIQSQKSSLLSLPTKINSGITLLNWSNDQDDFELDSVILKTPPKISPKRIPVKTPKTSLTNDLFCNGNAESLKSSVSNSNDIEESRDHSEESNSNNEWCTPIHPSMIVSPHRTPTPSPCKNTDYYTFPTISNKTSVSPSILKNPHNYGLKVRTNSAHCVPGEKYKVRLYAEDELYKNSVTLTSVIQSTSVAMVSSSLCDAKRALHSQTSKSATFISVSPNEKYLNLPLEKSVTPSPTKYRKTKGYYLENFCFIIDSIRSQPKDCQLLDKFDLMVLKDFYDLSLEAQKLYVRLFQRKIKWHRRNKIEYKDICDKEDTYIYLNELVYAKFLLSEEVLEDLNDILSLLSAEEVQNLCKDLKLPCLGKKDVLIERIKKFGSQQKSIVSLFKKVTNNSNTILAKKVKNIIGKCVLMNKERRSVFVRIFMLFSPMRLDEDEDGGQHSHMLNLLMVSMGKRSFPTYEVNITQSIFRTRVDLLRMEKCYHFYNEVQECIDSKNWEDAEIICNEVHEYYNELKEDQDLVNYDASLPCFLRRFTAISLTLHIRTHAVEVYQRLKHYKKAVNLLQELLTQSSHLQDYKGRWFDRLALNLEQHLKSPKQSFVVCQRALKDSEVMVGHRLSLSLRAQRLILSSKCKDISKELEEQLDLEEFQVAPKIVIQAKSLPADIPGYKRIFLNSYDLSNELNHQTTMCSVEELVVSYYNTQGYPEGLHCEGRTVHVLFGLYFWDIIYSSIPDVFRSAHQAVPFDLDSQHFYEARREIFEKRFDELEKSTVLEVNERLEQIWNENEGKISIVDWNIFKNISHLHGLVAGLGPKVIAGICRRLAKNHRFTRSGFPDLIVWDPKRKISRIVEVKGPNDRLSTKQILWLDYLLKIGAVAEVCHVEAVGAKRICDLQSRRVFPGKKNEDQFESKIISSPQKKQTKRRKSSDDFREDKRKKFN